jgi:hypothetical protein
VREWNSALESECRPGAATSQTPWRSTTLADVEVGSATPSC